MRGLVFRPVADTASKAPNKEDARHTRSGNIKDGGETCDCDYMRLLNRKVVPKYNSYTSVRIRSWQVVEADSMLDGDGGSLRFYNRRPHHDLRVRDEKVTH